VRALASCLLLYGLAVRPSLERKFGMMERASDRPVVRVAAVAVIAGLTVGSGLLLAAAGGASPDKRPEPSRLAVWDKLFPSPRGSGAPASSVGGGAGEP